MAAQPCMPVADMYFVASYIEYCVYLYGAKTAEEQTSVLRNCQGPLSGVALKLSSEHLDSRRLKTSQTSTNSGNRIVQLFRTLFSPFSGCGLLPFIDRNCGD